LSLDRLSIRGVRNIEAVELEPADGMNWLFGPNGAGKTSVLEAIYLLARGRSFRSTRVARIIQYGSSQLSVVVRRSDTSKRLGVERNADGWRGRIDGRDSQRISEFAAWLPLVLVEPGSHALIEGGPEQRRRFVDWQLFHVEPDYLDTWQQFARALRQRNAALKSGAPGAVLDALEPLLIDRAEEMTRARALLAERLQVTLGRIEEALAFRLPGPLTLRYRPGYRGDDLAKLLREGRSRDRERGFTRLGPHRADLEIRCNEQPSAEMSRGQQKLAAVALLLAQFRLLQEGQSLAPILLVDDPVSELDRPHLERLLSWLCARTTQCWVTSTERVDVPARWFHVEQGRVSPVI